MPKSYDELADGTGVRFNHLAGTGWMYVTEIRDGKIVGPDGELRTPSGLAADLDEVLRGKESHDSWGPGWWEYFSGDGWDELKSPK